MLVFYYPESAEDAILFQDQKWQKMYEQLRPEKFFRKVKNERAAIDLIWRNKFAGKDFKCTHCGAESYYEIATRSEVRQCRKCGRQYRVRAGTIFENSKKPLLLWCRAIHFMMQGKRGVSALEVQRLLGMKSYGTTYTWLRKIREALRQRDEGYQLQGVIEVDVAEFGKRDTENHKQVYLAVESKDWIDEKGQPKSKAGFAKVMVKRNAEHKIQAFIDKTITPGAMVNTDAEFRKVRNVSHDYQKITGDKETLDRWLPWVHKFISNAKTWIRGTHHGVSKRTLENYLSEYTYRFNRRHTPDTLFSRALRSCCLAKPVTWQEMLREALRA